MSLTHETIKNSAAVTNHYAILVGISIFFSGGNVNGEGKRKAAPKGD
jgi:hypothetical protein